MKKFVIVVLCFFTLLCAGCGDKELEPAKILRDDLRTGGSLSFVYDKRDKTVYIGGQDEVIEYSNGSIEKGFDEGCRVGLKVIAPNEELELSNATLTMNGTNYASGDFLETIDAQKQRFFNIYPLVSKEDEETKFSVKWQDGTKAQEYKIIVVEGTKFMQKDGSYTIKKG